jgi:protein-S-isoprenylcysteine O-methyltransferase Ste14
MRAIAQYMGMKRADLALALLLLYALLAFGVRMAIQLRRTGSSGFNGLRGASGFAARLGGLLLVLAALLCSLGPLLQLQGAIGPVRDLDGELAGIAGAALSVVGVVCTVLAQLAMGDAWRIGVDPAESTELVTDGPFAMVRNPIYGAMIPAFAGIALLAPNVLSLGGAVLLMLALEVHTRLIEEPYLLRVHGDRYRAYAARVGRFFPAIGRLRLEAGSRS